MVLSHVLTAVLMLVFAGSIPGQNNRPKTSASPAAGNAQRAGSRSAADLVFRNARILTMNDARPSANAIALAGERIAAVGSWEELASLVGPATEVYDLGGRTIIPGINESHIHVRDLGFEQHYAVNLEPSKNVADVQRLLRARLDALRRE